MRILVLTKRQYTNKDLIDDRFGRIREIPLALSQMGHSVTGICLSYSKKNQGWIDDGQVRWNSINLKPLFLGGLLKFFNTARKLARSADIIWACSDSLYGIIGQKLSADTGVPLVFDLYDNFDYFLAAKLPVIKQLYHRTVKRCAAVTCVSRPLTERVGLYGRRKNVYVLENAVRRDLFRPLDRRVCRERLKLPQDGFLVGTAGALSKNRGIDNLFEAFIRLHSTHPDVSLAVAGPRDVTIPQHQAIHDLGVLPLETVPVLFNALDIAVICLKSNDFGKYCFPQKAREIMACNVPLVAAKTGSLADIFRAHPEWLFEPEDPNSLTEALKERLSDKSTGYPSPPAWNEIAAQLEDIFIQICRDGR